MPFFSIIIPVYNTKKEYFTQCADSIFRQTFSDYEIIVVDDGSTDEYASFLDSFMNVNKQMQVIHKKHEGLSAARNRGMAEAKADWIMFVDADDWLENNALEMLGYYVSTVECEILFFAGVKEYSGKQRKMKYGLIPNTLYDNRIVETREKLYLCAMGVPSAKTNKNSPVYYSWDKVYSRRFLMNNQLQFPFGLRKSEDKVFILNCFEKIERMYHVNHSLYHYRINEGSICNMYSETADQDRIELADLLKDIAKRMDAELGRLKKQPEYHKVQHELDRFLFGIITDVLKQKFFHPDYPRSNSLRRKEVKTFLRSEPYKSALKNVRYSELSKNAKIKKFMLSHGLISPFYHLKRYSDVRAGKIAESIDS